MLENFIVIDANFILMPFQFKIDYLPEIAATLEGNVNFIVYKQVLDELNAKKLREPNATKFLMNLKSGLGYLDKNDKKYNILYLQNVKLKEETTDSFLLKSCQELKGEHKKVYLATNDTYLRRKARNIGIKTIFLRQKKYLSFE